MSIKNSNDAIGIQTGDLPGCSVVPQPCSTAFQHQYFLRGIKMKVCIIPSERVVFTRIHRWQLCIRMACCEGHMCNSVYCFDVTLIVATQERFDRKYKEKEESA